jgi:uncharacterized protein YgiM (DUF1202 family)
MKSTLAFALTLPLLAAAIPAPAAGDTTSVPSAGEELFKRADKWCYVLTSNVNCRKGAGTGYDVVRKIQPSDDFGVRCKAYGETIEGNR